MGGVSSFVLNGNLKRPLREGTCDFGRGRNSCHRPVLTSRAEGMKASQLRVDGNPTGESQVHFPQRGTICVHTKCLLAHAKK